MLYGWEGKLSNSQFIAISHFNFSFMISLMTWKPSYIDIPVAVAVTLKAYLFINATFLWRCIIPTVHRELEVCHIALPSFFCLPDSASNQLAKMPT
jgi:hypothetical protein